MTLDWATTELLEELAGTDGSLRSPKTVADLRAIADYVRASNGPGPHLEMMDDVTLESEDGGFFRVRLLSPRSKPSAIVVFFPGPAWGWVAGSLETADTVARKLAERTRSAFVVVDHRRGPEHPFPAAVLDARQALRWAEDVRKSLAPQVPSLVVLGEGSGGALAAVAARQPHQAGMPEVGLTILVSPNLDADRAVGAPSASEPTILDGAVLATVWDAYAPVEAMRDHPDAAPLRDENYATSSRVVVLAAEHDPLLPEAEQFVDKLRAQGVDASFKCFAGQMHGFFSILALPLGERAFQTVLHEVRAHASTADDDERSGR